MILIQKNLPFMKSNAALKIDQSFENFTFNTEKRSPAPVTLLYEEVLQTLNNQWEIPTDRITIWENNGWITLNGEVPWNFQRQAACAAIQVLPSVKGVINNLYAVSQARDERDKAILESAIQKNVILKNKEIRVSVTDSEVTLSGSVQTHHEKEEAERIAWTIPGIRIVDNDIAIAP
jgi:osmotically-inducible protein OsmY